MRRLLIALGLAALATVPDAALAQTARPPAQSQPRRTIPPPRPPAYPRGMQIRGFGTVGLNWFTASETFNAVLGSGSGTDFGGGLSVTEGPGFLDVGARRYSKTGQRVFVTDTREVFELGIPAKVTMTALDITTGWRFRPLLNRIRPHLGAGYTGLRYEESSEFADSAENIKEWFNGFHVVGGGEVRLHRLVGVTAEVVWTSIADAIGENGASKAFDENNLGGTSARLKLVIGR
jgi:hypothetical protein